MHFTVLHKLKRICIVWLLIDCCSFVFGLAPKSTAKQDALLAASEDILVTSSADNSVTTLRNRLSALPVLSALGIPVSDNVLMFPDAPASSIRNQSSEESSFFRAMEKRNLSKEEMLKAFRRTARYFRTEEERLLLELSTPYGSLPYIRPGAQVILTQSIELMNKKKYGEAEKLISDMQKKGKDFRSASKTENPEAYLTHEALATHTEVYYSNFLLYRIYALEGDLQKAEDKLKSLVLYFHGWTTPARLKRMAVFPLSILLLSKGQTQSALMHLTSTFGSLPEGFLRLVAEFKGAPLFSAGELDRLFNVSKENGMPERMPGPQPPSLSLEKLYQALIEKFQSSLHWELDPNAMKLSAFALDHSFYMGLASHDYILPQIWSIASDNKTSIFPENLLPPEFINGATEWVRRENSLYYRIMTETKSRFSRKLRQWAGLYSPPLEDSDMAYLERRALEKIREFSDPFQKIFYIELAAANMEPGYGPHYYSHEAQYRIFSTYCLAACILAFNGDFQKARDLLQGMLLRGIGWYSSYVVAPIEGLLGKLYKSESRAEQSEFMAEVVLPLFTGLININNEKYSEAENELSAFLQRIRNPDLKESLKKDLERAFDRLPSNQFKRAA